MAGRPKKAYEEQLRDKAALAALGRGAEVESALAVADLFMKEREKCLKDDSAPTIPEVSQSFVAKSGVVRLPDCVLRNLGVRLHGKAVVWVPTDTPGVVRLMTQDAWRFEAGLEPFEDCEYFGEDEE